MSRQDQNIFGGIGQPIHLECSVEGVPTPVYKWFFKNSNNDRKRNSVVEGAGITFSADKKHLFIDSLQMIHDGIFICTANNCLTPPAAKTKFRVNVRHKSKYF